MLPTALAPLLPAPTVFAVVAAVQAFLWERRWRGGLFNGVLFCRIQEERNGPGETSSKMTSRESCHLQLATASEVAPLSELAFHLRVGLGAGGGKGVVIENENDFERPKSFGADDHQSEGRQPVSTMVQGAIDEIGDILSICAVAK